MEGLSAPSLWLLCVELELVDLEEGDDQTVKEELSSVEEAEESEVPEVERWVRDFLALSESEDDGVVGKGGEECERAP